MRPKRYKVIQVISLAGVKWEDIRTPLAGHAGDCERVLHATVSGKTDAPCSCGATSK